MLAVMMFDFACLQISSLWERLLGAIGDAAGGALGRVVEAIRTLFEGDPETRRKVSFSVAIIALSATVALAAPQEFSARLPADLRFSGRRSQERRPSL